MRTSALLLLSCLPLAAQAVPAPDLRHGRLVDVLGEPVPAATVAVVRSSGAVAARAASDAQGLYRVRFRAEPGDELRVAAAGKAEHREAAGSGQRVVNVVLEDGAALHGRMTGAEGAPVAGGVALVFAGPFHAETAVAADGTFTFAAVPLRPAIVRGFGAGRVVERSLRVAGDVRCDLTLPGPDHAARLVSVRGLPRAAVATAFVQLMAKDLVLQPQRGRVALGHDGTAAVVPTCTSLVTIVAPGFVATPPGHLIDPGCRTPLEFTLAPAPLPAARTVLTGRVLDGAGHGIAGVRLAAADRGGYEVGRVAAAADGSFRLPVGLPPATFCRLGVELRDWFLEADRTRIARGHCWIDTTAEATFRWELRVVRAGGFHAELRARSGERFAFADLIVASAERPREPFVVAATDADGRCEVRGLPPGDYELTATSMAGEIACAAVRVGAGGWHDVTTWTFVPSGALAGTVRDAAGRPLAGLDLQLASPCALAGDVQRVEGRLDVRLVTDRHGRFGCRGLVAGEWAITVRNAPGVAGGFFAVGAGATTALDLRGER